MVVCIVYVTVCVCTLESTNICTYRNTLHNYGSHSYLANKKKKHSAMYTVYQVLPTANLYTVIYFSYFS